MSIHEFNLSSRDGSLVLPLSAGNLDRGSIDARAILKGPSLPLVVGVSTCALFECEDERQLVEREGVALAPGCAFDLVKKLLAANPSPSRKFVDVVLLSRCGVSESLRVFRACETLGLPIVAGSFTGGYSVAPYAKAWNVDLFLSRDDRDVRDVLALGIAAARLGPSPTQPIRPKLDEIHIVLDGDAVTFGAEADAVFRSEGLAAFEHHERDNALKTLSTGPFGGNLLSKLVALREECATGDGATRIRLTMLTAREAPAHERVVQTLRQWGVQFDEVHFVGARAKAPFLAAARAAVFFDDRLENVDGASSMVAAGFVPPGHLPARYPTSIS